MQMVLVLGVIAGIGFLGVYFWSHRKKHIVNKLEKNNVSGKAPGC